MSKRERGARRGYPERPGLRPRQIDDGQGVGCQVPKCQSALKIGTLVSASMRALARAGCGASERRAASVALLFSAWYYVAL